MVIVATLSFKKDHICQTRGSMASLPPLPHYINMMGPYIKNVKLGGGIQTVHLFEFDESRIDEARDFINERMKIYGDTANLTCSVDLWLDLKDIRSMTGLEEGQPYASA